MGHGFCDMIKNTTFKKRFIKHLLDEFGKWFQDRFSGAPSMIEQMAGVKEHYFTEVTISDVVAVNHALTTMKSSTHQRLLIEYIHEHVGKHISTENW